MDKYRTYGIYQPGQKLTATRKIARPGMLRFDS